MVREVHLLFIEEVWAPIGERPIAHGHHRFEWLYVTAFGLAIDPISSNDIRTKSWPFCWPFSNQINFYYSKSNS
jgi:hypothetical protein